jgi:hypothetical protein
MTLHINVGIKFILLLKGYMADDICLQKHINYEQLLQKHTDYEQLGHASMKQDIFT